MKGLYKKNKMSGFSLIEVLIAMLVLTIGLLGVGFLQTLSLAKNRASLQRSQATDLSYQIIDMMRANPLEAFRYPAGASGVIAPDSCNYESSRPMVGALTPAQDVAYWRCEVSKRLPGVLSTVSLENGEITVVLEWRDLNKGGEKNKNSMTRFETRGSL